MLVKVKKYFVIVCICVVSVTCSGCAELIALPFALISGVLSLVIGLIAKLLPLAIKYAPLALMFVSADPSTVDLMQAEINLLPLNAHELTVRSVEIDEKTQCLVVDMYNLSQEEKSVVGEFMKDMVTAEDAKVYLSHVHSSAISEQSMRDIHGSMVSQDVSVARDPRLVIPDRLRRA